MNARKKIDFLSKKIKNDKYALLRKNKNLNKKLNKLLKKLFKKKKDLNQIMIDSLSLIRLVVEIEKNIRLKFLLIN